jgi:hypothetical protein
MNRNGLARITLILTEEEFVALVQSAREDLRRPRDQARFILRQVLLGGNEPIAGDQRKGQAE